MGTGQRTVEERVRAGHWKQRHVPSADPARMRYMSQDQWTLAQQFRHHRIFQMPVQEDATAEEAEDAEIQEFAQGPTSSSSHSWGTGTWWSQERPQDRTWWQNWRW